ncbi:centrosomal protein of 131 kDa isoform X2 [Gopherus flavomarginatus]|uniref:centrosomal protein of 131 kDa isoform X2 n=1 Tax=Gopherus flavomarginatus TaxID=286002 RepID=UPI0021CB9F34|nr:centrosomal protein of 131 kDa isoform X2 [Gopherus flavomarginatus]
MKSTRSSSSFQAVNANGLDLCLTGLPLQVLRRPSSASPAKHIARSISVITESKARRNAPEDAGIGCSRAINNLRRSNSTTQVNQQANGAFRAEQPGDFLTFFDSSSGGRKKLASLSKTSPEKKTTWNILDDQPRVFPIPSSTRSSSTLESPAGMRKKETTVLLAPNFTANNRSNKGAMGNCVTTMVHNNYSTTDKASTPKSSNQAATSLNNMIKATSNEDSESSSFKKSQKNFSSNNIMPHNNSSSLLKRKEVTEEEAERFIHQVNLAAVTIQRWYRRHSQRHTMGAATLGHLLASKREERQQPRMEEGNVLDLQRKKDEERRRIREEKAQVARRAAIQELQQKRAQKASDAKRLAEEELLLLKEGRRVGRKKPTKPTSVKNISPANSIVKANNADANFCTAAAEPKEMSPPGPGSGTGQDNMAENKPQDVNSRELASEELQTGVTATSRAQSKVTLSELLDTLKLLEEEPELMPQPKLYKKDKYAWIDGEADSNSLTADNLEKFGKLNHCPGVPGDGALLSEAKLQSIITFLDEMEKSEQERPRSAASATQQEGLLSEEEVAHLEQASAVATEVTSSIMRLKLEVEEKKRAITLLQTALAQQRELTVRHVKETEKELSHQLQLQREQYESAIQRHLAFIDQLIDDKKVLSEKCEAVVAELKQMDQKYTKKISQMQEQHELAEVKVLKDRLEIEKQMWEANYMKKEEAWLLSRERELKEEVRKERDKEIELVIQRLEADMSSTKEECERVAENRIKRVRDKYEAELQELERSERKLQERCNELKGRLAEREGENMHLQGLVKHKEQEVEDIRKVKDQLAKERSSLSEVIRQEFADRLVGTEEENKRLKAEMAEMRARQRLELDRIARDKDEELEEVHKRVKMAIVKKEEMVNVLRKQYEAAVKRADHLEALLEQQRKQLLATN